MSKTGQQSELRPQRPRPISNAHNQEISEVRSRMALHSWLWLPGSSRGSLTVMTRLDLLRCIVSERPCPLLLLPPRGACLIAKATFLVPVRTKPAEAERACVESILCANRARVSVRALPESGCSSTGCLME